MKTLRRAAFIMVVGAALAIPAAAAGATPSPNGPGQPGAPNTTCGSPNTALTPGASASAQGSPFNASGTAGTVYAGNPGTASLAHANSTHAVSQYDIACFQVTQH
jgi:hypothetical protein